jgi:GDPmannose 4,6-dehydratase
MGVTERPVALVTGITGQTGGYLAELLIANDWAVHGVVRDADDAEASFVDRSPQARLHSGDLADSDLMKQIVAEVRPDAIFNLGGISSVAYSWDHPQETGAITGLGVASLLDGAMALRGATGRRVSFVQASSAEIFGTSSEQPQTELTPIRPVNPYGAAKAYAHLLVGVYRGLGLEASSCILYNHESPRRPLEFVTRKITREVALISLGRSNRLELGNLDAVRDWGWAPDYARALYLAAVGDPGDYIIASGVGHTVRDFVAAAFAAAGIDEWSDLVYQNPQFMRPVDATALVGDPSRARDILGWVPEVSFDEMVRVMVESDIAELWTGDAP